MTMRVSTVAGLCACLLLAGCAGPTPRPAPVEDRSVGGGALAAPPAVPPPTTGDAVTVVALPAPDLAGAAPRPLPADGPAATPTPLPPAGPGGAPAPGASPGPTVALSTPVNTTPAVDDILRDVRRRWAEGQHEQAAAGLERALRIEPANPYLWQHLAAVRLDQGKPQLAEQFAAKSNSVAGDSAPLRLRNWRLIAEARRLQGNAGGAREAEARAREYEAAGR